jgi:hypothetical protein
MELPQFLWKAETSCVTERTRSCDLNRAKQWRLGKFIGFETLRPYAPRTWRRIRTGADVNHIPM